MMRRLAVVLLLASACGDDGGGACVGVGDAGVPGATITVGAESFGYGGFLWGENNDCGPDSVTVQGGQTSPPSDFGIGLCVPDPDAVGAGPVPLGSLVELRGAAAEAAGCVYQYTSTATPSGTVTFGGLCTAAGASFTVSFAATVPGTRTCAGGAAEPITMTLGGTALVTPRP